MMSALAPRPDIHVVPPPGTPAVGVLALARDGSVLEADAAAWRILGAKAAQDARDLRVPARVEGEQREALAPLLDRVFDGCAAALELDLPGLDGARRQVQAHAVPLRDAAGGVRAAAITLHDLTDEPRQQQARADAAREFRTLAENLPDNVALYDRQCRAVYVNPAMRTGTAADIVPVLGLTPAEQSAGIPWARQFQRRIEEVLATGVVVEMEAPIRNPAGELRTDHVVLAPVRAGDGEIAGVIAIGRDLTQRKAAEASLRKLSLAVEQSPASILITDTGGRIEYVNAKFTEVTGYSAAEALGQNPRILKSGQTPPEVYRELWHTISSGAVWRGEFHNRKKSGELYWEMASVSPVYAADGKITHYVAVKEDITERKRLEEGLRQAQKMDALGRLAGGVAHDFNNLLTVIQTGAVQLREGGLGQDEGRELLDQISEAAERAARLTRQLLTFSHRRPAQRITSTSTTWRGA
jgi:PAS domain S-box-containing protein